MTQNLNRTAKIAIIGGGIAGSSVALYLAELGLQVSLFEKGPSLVNGPPICHLHAGGNLYREISQDQCITLLHESIDLLRLYPNAVDRRPTVIAVPEVDKGQPLDLLPRLQVLQKEYQQLVDQDASNQLLGNPDDYYQLFSKQQLLNLAELDCVAKPATAQQWMIPVAKNLDLNKLKFPVVLVQEFGLNIFRLAATASLALESNEHCHLHTNCQVNNLKQLENKRWQVCYGQQNSSEEFDYLVNSAGFRSGLIDDLLALPRQRIVEFKAAYVTQWPTQNTLWPEVIIHGERGTPQGMAQFTPYPGQHVQLHGMTEEITLFKEGLVASAKDSAQPLLQEKFIKKIDQDWCEQDVIARSQRAIEHIAQYIPSFSNATVASKPLFGAQQIPGGDAELRAAGVSFDGEHYARCEIVKASSVLSCADAITEQLIHLGLLDVQLFGSRYFPHSSNLNNSAITQRAEKYAAERGYPLALAHRCVP